MTEVGASTVKRREDDCEMVTTLASNLMSKNELCLHEAARKNDVEIVTKILVKRGAEVDCRNQLDRTALHLACARGNKDIVDVLLKFKANINSEDKYGMTPIHWAAYYQHDEVVQMLVARGANIQKRNKQGMTLVHIIAESNCLPLYKYIRSKHKRLKLDTLDNNQMTPLLVAAAHNSIDVLRGLLADNFSYTVCDKDGHNALHLATKFSFNEILQELLKITELKEVINKTDSEQMAPLHYAASSGNHIGVGFLLLVKNLNLEQPSENGSTGLMLAAKNGHEEVMKALLKAKAHIDAKNDHGNTALHYAAVANKTDSCRLLLTHKANINCVNNRLQTPLHASVEQNKVDSSEVLLLYGADTNLLDKAGKTPLLLATRASYLVIVDMIIKAKRFHQRRREALEYKHQRRHRRHRDNANSAAEADVAEEDIAEHAYIPADASNTINVKMEEYLKRDFIAEGYRLSEFNQIYADEFKVFLWKLSNKHLRYGEWKKLANHWKFEPQDILAIEHQQSGDYSYKQHSYRLLCIWFHGLDSHDTPVRELYEAFVAIGRRKLADQIRKDLNVGGTELYSRQDGRSCVIS